MTTELKEVVHPYDETRDLLIKQEPFISDKVTGETIPGIFRKYGLPVEVKRVVPGPTITTVLLKLHAITSKLSILPRIEKDIAFYLNVPSARLVLDNVNGLIGIEIPSATPVPVRLSGLLTEEWCGDYDGMGLNFPAGVTVDGSPVWYSLEQMPHLLVAGTTGSGKSVFLNSLITTLLIRYIGNVQLVLIDPKRGVEFGMYEGLPQLRLPNSYTSEAAASALSNVQEEMDRRYIRFKIAGVRDIKSYNSWALEGSHARDLPWIVVVIDEAAFLFDDYPDVQDLVVTIAQLGRAAGIHLVMATQRPSADIVTGRVKANFPARVSFRTASAVDSKVILDRTGAEKLLGHGDGLFHIPGHEDQRIQSCMVTTDEVKRVVDWWQGR